MRRGFQTVSEDVFSEAHGVRRAPSGSTGGRRHLAYLGMIDMLPLLSSTAYLI